MDNCKPRRNILNIKPYKARTVNGNDDFLSSDTGLPKFGELRDTLELKLDSADSGNSESTPKRGAGPTSEEVRTPTDKPVVLEEEFSPIELFPYSQTQSAPIIQWDYNAVQRSSRTGVVRRSRPSSGPLPFPPEIKLPKRRTPSPTTEDMPPPKKASQEGLSALQQHVKALQELVSSDEENSETEEDKLGHSMHQSLHISDRLDRSMLSPDPFDSAPNEFETDEQNKWVADPPEGPTNPTPAPEQSSKSAPKLAEPTPEPKPVETEEKTSHDMSIDIDDSLLIACTEMVETEVRLSQQQQEMPSLPPVVPAKKAIKASPKKNGTAVNGLQRGRLQVVNRTSPKKKPPSPNPHKKPVAGPPRRQSDGKEFDLEWVNEIKKATSPLNGSFKASQSGEKSIHRNILTPSVVNKKRSFGLDMKGKSQSLQLNNKEIRSPLVQTDCIELKLNTKPTQDIKSESNPTTPAALDTKSESKPTTPAALDNSIDPFEDSFDDANIEELDKVEALAISQMPATQKLPELTKPVPSSKPKVIKPRATNLQRFTSSSSIPVKPSFPVTSKPAQPFVRHQSAPNFPKFQPQHPNPPPKPTLPARPHQQNTALKQPSTGQPLYVINKQPFNLQFQASKAPVVTVMPTPAVSNRLANMQTDKPPAVQKKSPLIKHKSADFTNKSNKPPSAVATTAKLVGGMPLTRHRSVDFFQVQPKTQRRSTQEIEMNRLEAKKKLAMKNQRPFNSK